MLVRSAGRSQRRAASQSLATSFAQLQLPWLAPAQLRWTTSHSTPSSQSPARARRRSLSRSRRARDHIRQLATAAGADTFPRHTGAFPPPGYVQDQNVPWDLSNSQSPDLAQFRSRPYDDPVIINRSTETAYPLIRVQRGVIGTARDLLQQLHTSLRVGRRSRAEAILQRLVEQCSPDSPELLYAHTAYLEESLKTLAAHGRGTKKADEILKEMQTWFEKEMRVRGTTPDGKVLVVMLRASIRALEGPKRDRTVRRYVELAQSLDEDTYDEVLYSEEYDDNEFTILGRVASEYYRDPDDAEMEALAEEFDAKDSGSSIIEPQPGTPLDMIDMSTVPEVTSVSQKGHGLESVKRTLETFLKLAAPPPDAPPEVRRARQYERQRLMEETSVDVAVERWRKEDQELKKIGINTNMRNKSVGALMWQWYQALVPALEEELQVTKKVLAGNRLYTEKRDDPRKCYGPYLELLPLEKLAASTILYTMSLFARSDRPSYRAMKKDTFNDPINLKLSSLCVSIGKNVEQECSMDASKSRMKTDRGFKRASQRMSVDRLRRVALRHFRDKTMMRDVLHNKTSQGKSSNVDLLAQLHWPLDVKVRLGAVLVEKMTKTAQLLVTRQHPRSKEMVSQMQPAFLHTTKYSLGRKTGMLSLHPDLQAKMRSEPPSALITKRMPMVVEPAPWTEWAKGGYLHYSNPVLRLPHGDLSGKDYFVAAHNKGDTTLLYKGLNVLSSIPWRINHDVFRVLLDAWNSGEAVGNLAPLNPDLEAPQEPKAADGGIADIGAHKKYLIEMKDLANKRSGLHSQRSFQNFQMEIARAMANETLYFPHNMDFRGRAYPIPPYLNHMGADNVRGLLVFAKGKELGSAGFRWLKIHVANVFGYDKASLQEREDFTDQHIDDIRDSVANPLGGRRWWLRSEDAWQTLAACFELVHALDHPEGPEKYINHLPIHQDGTCNGLQHYAALGGDKAGAAQVNLEPSDRPADIYSAVARAVQAEVAEDAAEGNPIAQMLDGKITRKVVKQPVMTNVYGVTFYGAKTQVQKQIEEIFPDLRRYDAVNHVNMSLYIVSKIFRSLGSMFKGAQAIQHWLGLCADRISTALTPEQMEEIMASLPHEAETVESEPPQTESVQEGKSTKTRKVKKEKSTETRGNRIKQVNPLFKSTVVWTTPLRLPVVQPYRKSKSRPVTTNLQDIHLQEPQVWDPVHKRKQLQAFPPNFIHSLDASHMLMSAIKCHEDGLTFASIHDSFWTHASDIEHLSTTLRDQFVAMHSDDIIGRLKEEFDTRYKRHYYYQALSENSAVGRKIRKWRLANKVTKEKEIAWELKLETERLRLLESDDPAERVKGEAMVTPGSIVASMGQDAQLLHAWDLEGMMLGDIPSDAGAEPTNSDADADASLLDDGVVDDGVVPNSVMAHDTQALAEAGSELEPESERDGDDIMLGPTNHQPVHLMQNLKKEDVKRPPRKMYVWLPLKFPDVPAKGDFDVTRLKESKYFFH